MPVLMIGVMLVSSTLRASMPAGVPVKFIAGKREALLRPKRDVRHLARVGDGIVRRAADELHDRRGGGHRKPAESGSFRDRAVAHVGRGVLRSVGRESKVRSPSAPALRTSASPVPDRRMPKRTPLRDIAVTMLLPARHARHRASLLHAAIDKIQKEVIVAGDEGEASAIPRWSNPQRSAAGTSFLRNSEDAGGVAVVRLVAHLQRLRDERLQLQRPERRQHRLQSPAQAHPPSSAAA